MNLSEELTWRGLVNQTTYPDLNALNGSPITFYWGVDPSADSMTVGNLAAAMMVKAFMRHGHNPVLLIGGATGMVGDPDGKSEERQLLTKEVLDTNKAALVKQYEQIFGNGDFTLVDNYDWFKGVEYLEFLRDIGKHVPLRQMLARDFVQSRLGEDGSGISYAEFSYVLIQAYDFLQLFLNHKVTLQVCGADQWGNTIAGVDLIRRKTGGEAHVFSMPLVIDTTTGRKFGKSEAGAVWLDPKKTTPTEFYQFWINTDDQNVENFLKIYTELDKPNIENIMSQHQTDPGARLAQHKLAEETTRLVHGETATQTAQTITNVLIGQSEISDLDEATLDALRQEIPHANAEPGSELAEALVATSLASSKTDARQLISSNAISINNQKVQKDNLENSDFKNGRLLLRRGKAFKDSALVERS